MDRRSVIMLFVVAVIYGYIPKGLSSSAVLLTSNLMGSRAYDAQNVTFRCTTQGNATVLTWFSENYIGSAGAILEFASVHTPGRIETSSTNPNTTAVLMNVTTDTDTGETVIVSELYVRASLQYPNSSVGCRVNGSPNTTIFSVVPPNVLLTSNLNEGKFAYDAQNITFRCTTRGTGTILTWISENYIGSEGAIFEFASVHTPGRIEISSTNPNTTAVLINATTDTNTGVTEIVSELYITASLQYPNSSVSCRVNGRGTPNTTNFQLQPTVDTTSEIASVSDNPSSAATVTVTGTESATHSLPAILTAVGAITVVIAIVVIAVIIVIIGVKRISVTLELDDTNRVEYAQTNHGLLKKKSVMNRQPPRPGDQNNFHSKSIEHQKLVPSTASSSSSISSSSKSMSNSPSTTSTMTTISAASAQSQGEQNILSDIPEETDDLSTVTESCNNIQVQEQDNLSTCTQTISCKDAPVKESPTKMTPSDNSVKE